MPGVSWAKNLLFGRTLTEAELRDIPYPRLELHTHVMYKTIQVGRITLLVANLINPNIVSTVLKITFSVDFVYFLLHPLRMGTSSDDKIDLISLIIDRFSIRDHRWKAQNLSFYPMVSDLTLLSRPAPLLGRLRYTSHPSPNQEPTNSERKLVCGDCRPPSGPKKPKKT